MKTIAFYFVVVMLLVVGCSAIKNDAQYPQKLYIGGKNLQIVVQSDKGLVLTKIDVSPDMQFCIFSTIDTLPNLQVMPVTVKGILSIRIKPSSEIKPGNLEPQFAESAYRLDIKDAVAIVDTSKK